MKEVSRVCRPSEEQSQLHFTGKSKMTEEVLEYNKKICTVFKRRCGLKSDSGIEKAVDHTWLVTQFGTQVLGIAGMKAWASKPLETERTWMKTIRLAMTVILMVSLALLCTPAFAQTGEYETIAKNFLLFLRSEKQIITSTMIQANELDPSRPKVDIAFLANLSQGGYILVSTSRLVSPIKAYSLTSDFHTLPDAYKKTLFLEGESRIRNLAVSARLPLGLSDTEKSWDFLIRFDPASRTALEYVPDTYLLTTRWNQDDPYNRFLPEVDGQKALAGCANIALAQLMRHHGYPAAGQGVSSYTWNNQFLEAVFYRPYHWENMPDTLGLAEEAYRVDEVALLIRDLAIMNKTSFGLGGSSASVNLQALTEHFGYSRSALSITNADAAVFFNTLRGEIDAMRPVIVELPGHFVVADGYRSDPTGRKIHLNMGWGGHYDDYYFLDQPIVAGPYTFPPDITIYFNIKPCSGADCVMNLEPQDHVEGWNITGSFDFEADADRYEISLKGTTNLSGSRGYSNQAFYISVYDSHHVLVASDSKPLQLDLAAGRYAIRISLKSESGSGYEYDEYTDYSVQITTDPLSDVEEASITAGLDIQPIIGNTFKDCILNSSDPSSVRILIDARDENGDALTLTAVSTNTAAVQAGMEGDILILSSVQGVSNLASRIIVRASANGKTTEKSFIAMVSDQPVGFGKSFKVTGLFESQSDYNVHKVILDGACTITGYNGYSNQTFFSSVLDKNNREVCSLADEPISRTFSKDIYFLGASLEEDPGGYGLYYTYDPGVNDRYLFTISCPQADEQTVTIAAILGIDLSANAVPGDLDNNRQADLADAILGFQVLTGMKPTGLRVDFASSYADVNGDGKLGMAEVIYILQHAAGLR